MTLFFLQENTSVACTCKTLWLDARVFGIVAIACGSMGGSLGIVVLSQSYFWWLLGFVVGIWYPDV